MRKKLKKQLAENSVKNKDKKKSKLQLRLEDALRAKGANKQQLAKGKNK